MPDERWRHTKRAADFLDAEITALKQLRVRWLHAQRAASGHVHSGFQNHPFACVFRQAECGEVRTNLLALLGPKRLHASLEKPADLQAVLEFTPSGVVRGYQPAHGFCGVLYGGQAHQAIQGKSLEVQDFRLLIQLDLVANGVAVDQLARLAATHRHSLGVQWCQ